MKHSICVHPRHAFNFSFHRVFSEFLILFRKSLITSENRNTSLAEITQDVAFIETKLTSAFGVIDPYSCILVAVYVMAVPDMTAGLEHHRAFLRALG